MTAPAASEGQVVPAVLGGTATAADDLAHVEQWLHTLLAQAAGPRVAALGGELARAGGKRLRPRLFLLAFRSLSATPPTPATYRLAAALELLHLATLAHDDVIDGARLRRSRPSLNAAYGERPAVLVGDFFFSRFLAAAAPTGPRALQVMAAAISAMVEGELEQARHRFDLQLEEKDYYGIIAKKTAAFLAAACEVGALAARASRARRSALRRFGLYLGCAFQIQDDILDYVGDPDVLGKPSGSDLTQGVVTLPLIHTLRAGRAAASVQQLLQRPPLTAEKLARVRRQVAEGDGVPYARARADGFFASALEELQALPESLARCELVELVKVLQGREY
ncbi:MAG: heptaprenyl diphosphate synthase component 2 [Bacillota bacterium]|nr:heptaprenyl diphosphate synthase component 2 [Bacillota bacterium]